MAATSEAMIDRLVTILAIVGTEYTLTSRVTLGHVAEAPPSAPWVTLAVSGLTSKADDSATSLSKWRFSHRVEIEGWVAGVTDTPDGRLRAALRLLSDITAAIGADRSLGARCIDVVPELTALDGDAHGLPPGYGFVAGTLVIDYHTTGRS